MDFLEAKSVPKNIIYGLADPETGEIRYIGKSTSALNRPKQHLSPYFLKKSDYKNNWIKTVLVRGLRPTIEILDWTDDPSALNEMEIRYIAQFRSAGARLTNLTDGGDGTVGHRWTDEEVKNISRKNVLAKAVLAPDGEASLCAKYVAGTNTYLLAKEFGIDRHTVMRVLERNSIPRRSKTQILRAFPNVQEGVDLYNLGWSTQAIAKKFDTYPSTVYMALKKAGCKMRNRSEALLVFNKKEKE